MENVFVDGASGVEVDQQEALWKTSTWTQDVTQEKLYLEVCSDLKVYVT